MVFGQSSAKVDLPWLTQVSMPISYASIKTQLKCYPLLVAVLPPPLLQYPSSFLPPSQHCGSSHIESGSLSLCVSAARAKSSLYRRMLNCIQSRGPMNFFSFFINSVKSHLLNSPLCTVKNSLWCSQTNVESIEILTQNVQRCETQKLESNFSNSNAVMVVHACHPST